MTYIEFHEIEKAFRYAVRTGAPGISEVLRTAIVSSAMRRILPLVDGPNQRDAAGERIVNQ
mgnify:CR=1 FL=1